MHPNFVSPDFQPAPTPEQAPAPEVLVGGPARRRRPRVILTGAISALLAATLSSAATAAAYHVTPHQVSMLRQKLVDKGLELAGDNHNYAPTSAPAKPAGHAAPRTLTASVDTGKVQGMAGLYQAVRYTTDPGARVDVQVVTGSDRSTSRDACALWDYEGETRFLSCDSSLAGGTVTLEFTASYPGAYYRQDYLRKTLTVPVVKHATAAPAHRR